MDDTESRKTSCTAKLLPDEYTQKIQVTNFKVNNNEGVNNTGILEIFWKTNKIIQQAHSCFVYYNILPSSAQHN